MRKMIIAGAAAALSGVALAAALVLPSHSMTVHGTLKDCNGNTNVSGGSQLIVHDSSGTVIGNTTLTAGKSTKGIIMFGVPIGFSELFKFTVTVPSGESRYGITADGATGEEWLSPADMEHPALSVGC